MSRPSFLPVPATPLDDEDLLQEILLRLPPQPSSLPRASLVCPRWRSIVSDPKFLHRFRKHHRRPPLLGFFKGSHNTKHVFTPVLEPPNRIPAARFPVPLLDNEHWDFMGCRHGLVVLINEWEREIAVWDPLTGQQHRVTFPVGLNNALRGHYKTWDIAVLCTDAEEGHVHGDCFSSPFKLALVCVGKKQTFGSLYDSTSGVWGNICLTAATYDFFSLKPNILVGNAFFWLSSGGDVLVFNFEIQSLCVIEKVADKHVFQWHFQLLRTKDGGLGLAISWKQTIQLWQRKSNYDGVVRWVSLQKTIPLEWLFPRRMHSDHKIVVFVGYDDETNLIVLSTMVGVFMLQLDSMQIKQIIKRNDICYLEFHPYTNFYAGGIAGGDGEAENEDINRPFLRYLLSRL